MSVYLCYESCLQLQCRHSIKAQILSREDYPGSGLWKIAIKLPSEHPLTNSDIEGILEANLKASGISGRGHRM